MMGLINTLKRTWLVAKQAFYKELERQGLEHSIEEIGRPVKVADDDGGSLVLLYVPDDKKARNYYCN
jgi:hypothetical protein